MKSKPLFLLAFLPCFLPLVAQAQTPKPGAHISEYHLEGKPADGADGGTLLSITYDDGTNSAETVPIEPADAGNIPAVFSDVRLADDKQTLGWEMLYDNCCQSYPIPLTLVLYKSGKIIQRITKDAMIWDWVFIDGGKKVAIIWGPTHGAVNYGYHLYDVASGKVLEEAEDDWDTQKLKADAPEWARQLEYHMNHRTPG